MAALMSLSLLLNQAQADSGAAKERRRFNLTADLTYNSNTVKTNATASSVAATASSTFTAVEVGVDYFFHPRFAATAQMLFTLTSSINSEIKGFDIGARYYPFTKGYQTEAELLGSKIESTPGWASFLYGGFSNRDFQFSNSSISFQGPEAGVGVDYHFEQRFFLRGGLNYQMLQNTTSRTLNGFVASLGMGYAF